MKLSVLISLLFISFNASALRTGDKAPEFKLKGEDGKEYSLSQFAGKTVVLEWLNHGCPFVKKHYNSKNMQKLQEEYTSKGIKWISIISSAPGKQGYVDAKGAKEERIEKGSKADYILLDPSGSVGEQFGAQTTPHMYVIDKKGMLAYQGAIDDTPSTDPDDIKSSKNYVKLALDSLLSGKKVKIGKTKPYGCSVKYK